MQGSCTGLYLRLGFGCPAVCLAFTGKGGDIKLPVYGCGCARHSRLLPFLSYDHMWLPQAVPGSVDPLLDSPVWTYPIM